MGTPYTSYFALLSDALALAATLPAAQLTAWLAASSDQQTLDLQQASMDVDRGMRYQGRKYALDQINEFPRVPHEVDFPRLPYQCADVPLVNDLSNQIWDWDPVNLVAVVPQNVLTAVLYQANFIESGGDAALDDQYSGVTSEGAGSVHKSYDRKNPANETGLCRRAFQMLRFYQLQTGGFR